MKESKGLTAAMIALLALFVLSAAIAAPILLRPFYYWQIGPLGIEANTGLPRQEIIAAYDEMLDFCIGVSSEFSTGALKWSESGRDHFVDVRRLFLLDLGIAGGSGVGLLACWFVRRKTGMRPRRLAGHNPGFWAGTGLLGAGVLTGGLAALDFERAFVVFHALFFPGKDNWLFNPRVDEIILILPETFFRNCGILILILVLAGCTGMIAADLWRRHSTR